MGLGKHSSLRLNRHRENIATVSITEIDTQIILATYSLFQVTVFNKPLFL